MTEEKLAAIEAKYARVVPTKPCPFCGGDELSEDHMDGTYRHPAFRVVCGNCGASSEYYDSGNHIAAWNRRAGNAKRRKS